MDLIISFQVLLISLNILFYTVVSLDSDSKYYYEPVVLTGNDLPELLGVNIEEIVAFQYYDEWIQIPIQIDEKHIQNWEVIKNNSDCR